MDLTHVPIAAAALLMAAAATTDVRGFVIPNWISVSLLAVLAVAQAFGAVAPSPLSAACSFAAIFAATGSLWLAGRFGGGDFKLMSASAAWVGLEGLPTFLLGTALAGGLLAVLYLAFRKAVPSDHALRAVPALRQSFEHPGIPYGVAIAAGGIGALLSVIA